MLKNLNNTSGVADTDPVRIPIILQNTIQPQFDGYESFAGSDSAFKMMVSVRISITGCLGIRSFEIFRNVSRLKYPKQCAAELYYIN